MIKLCRASSRYYIVIVLMICIPLETIVHANAPALEAKVNVSVYGRDPLATPIKYFRVSLEESPFGDYPEIFTVEQLRQGWILLHVFAVIYFFILLALICNHYFLPTVEYICEDLNLSKDVAAATFMATATSMPEFFTNTINTLLVQSDLGVGNIIGSLMFNTLGVAGLAALAINKPIQLDWWPIIRDCCLYTCNTLILLVLTRGGYINFSQSCIMMIFLIVYYLITFNNNRFMPVIRVFIEDKLNCCISKRYDLTKPPENSAKAQLPVKKDTLNGDGMFSANTAITVKSTSSSPIEILPNSKKWPSTASESCDSPRSSLFSLPRGKTKYMQLWWCYILPIRFILSCCIPDPFANRRFYPVTFIMCIIVIGVNSYLVGWMLTSIGAAINVPAFIMGMTFLAFGSATPEAVSSIISLRNGENGIGVSNSLGANSLAILLSLGVPWFIVNCQKYATTRLPSQMEISGQNFNYNVIILILCTIGLFTVLTVSEYRLTKRAGIYLLLLYIVFILLQILLEMGILNPNQALS